MAVVLGTDGYRYEVEDGWAKLPPGMEFNADVAAVGVDKHDNVYAFNRGKHPMCVFDRDGNLLRTWGEGIFPRAHGVFMAPDDTIWLTDDGDHTVRQCTLDGKILLTIGIPGKPAPYMSGEPFHRCTHTAMSPDGKHLYISDGYGNARIHKFTADGKWLMRLGRARHRPRQVQHPAQHLLRRRRLGLCRRPRKPPRPGVRRQRQIRDAMEQHAPRLGAVHGDRHDDAALLCRRDRAGHGGQHRHAGLRAARQHLHAQGRAAGAARPRACRARARPVHLAARPRGRLRAATSMSARSRYTNWGRRVRAKGEEIPPGLRSLQKLVKVS